MIEPSATPPGAQADATRIARLGCAICDPAVSFGAIVGFGAKERAVEVAADLSVACVLTPEQQAAAIQRFVAEPVDVLIVKPLESDVVAAALRNAAETGISSVLVDGRVGGFEPNCSVSFDNVRGAELAAAFLVDQLPETGTVAHLHGPRTSVNAFDRSYGFHNVVDHRSSIRVVETISEWTRCAGASAMRELLNVDSIDGVFANSDALALGAVDAISEAGLTGEIVVTGFDGLPDALLEITRGTIAATVRQMPEAMGRLAIDIALRIHAGEKVPPVVQVDFGLVTQSNVAQASFELLPIFPRILRDLIQGDSALADERAVLRTLIDNLPDLIYVKDTDSRFLLVNEAAAAHLGAPTPNHAIGKTDFDFFPDEYATKYRADEERLLESGRPLINHEERTPAATGDLRWISTTKVATRNESGLITGLVGMSRDITESRATQAERARLVEEHEALHRLATLVMASAPSQRLFAAVAEEVASLLGGLHVEVIRYGADKTFTVVGASGDHPFPVDSRWPLDGPSVAASVLESGQPARIDDYSQLPGRVAEAANQSGSRSAIGAPIMVAGAPWGAIIVITTTMPKPIPDGTETQLGLFTDLMATAIANAQSQEALAQLVEEQAALRRVATLIAHDVQASEIFAAVSEEVAGLFKSAAGVLRFEHGSGIVWVGVANVEIPIGTRWEFEEGMTAAAVYRTGRPARVEDMDWSGVAGPVGEAGRRLGVVSTVASPIVVEDRLWGAMIVSRLNQDRLPPDTEVHLEKFTELVGTAIANAQSRESLAELAEEQAALRRVATLVAEGATGDGLFAAVSQEVARVLGTRMVTVDRYDPDGFSTVIASLHDPGFPVGSRWPLDGPSLGATVLERGRPARIDDYADLESTSAAAIREWSVTSAVGAPILVDGRPWGVICAGTTGPMPMPPGVEEKLGDFTELVAAAIARAESRQELARVADEQAALRRVATLIARAVDPSLIFSAVCEEAARVFGSAAGVLRFEGDTGVVFVGVSNIDIPIGTRWPFAGGMTTTEVYRTGRPARVEQADWSGIPGPAADASRRLGTRSIVGCPIVVVDRLWGALVVSSTENVLPPDTEQRVEKFTDLIATAIATAEVRQARAQLADEQDALQRLAMLVAEGRPARDIFDAVCLETSQLLGARAVSLSHYTSDGYNLTMAGTHLPAGTRVPIEPNTVAGAIIRTGAPARVDDWNDQSGQLADLIHDLGVRSSLGVPIFVEGRLWGALNAGTDEEEPLQAGTEERLGRFAELLATAISNAATRTELIESRARIVAAGDEARHRIERNLHDGTQQRLIALGLDIQRVRATISEDEPEARLGLERVEQDLDSVLEELRQLSRGLHPPLLARRGLPSALGALARDSPIPVELELDLPERPSPAVETAVYYVTSEAVTNAIRHSNASVISVKIEADHGSEPSGDGPDGRRLGGHLHATITDDGIGGADPTVGSGLTGLADRIAALGGRFVLDNPSGGGTRISIELPLESH